MNLTIYEGITLIIALLALLISIKNYRLMTHPSNLAEKQLSKLIKDETVSKLTLDLKHSSYDEHQDFIIANVGKVEAHNVNITFNPPINFHKYDKEKLDKKFPQKVLYPGKKIFIEYQYHIYGKRNHFGVVLQWNDPDGKIQNKVFHL